MTALPNVFQWRLVRSGTNENYFQQFNANDDSDHPPEYQVYLAKGLLQSDHDSDLREAVRYLTVASKQGHAKATEILTKSVCINRGITDYNISEIRACLNKTEDEINFEILPQGEEGTNQFRAALKLASRVSAGLPFKTRRRFFLDLIDTCFADNPVDQECRSRWKRTDDYAENNNNNEHLIQNSMLLWTINSQVPRGELPKSRIDLVAFDYESHRLNLFLKFLHVAKHPAVVMSWLVWLIISVISLDILFSFFIYSPLVKFCLILSCFVAVKSSTFLACIYYSFFLIITCAGCRMLCYEKVFYHFRIWANFCLLFNGRYFIRRHTEINFWRDIFPTYKCFFLFLLMYIATQYYGYFQYEPKLTYIAILFIFFLLYSYVLTESQNLFVGATTLDVISVLLTVCYLALNYIFETNLICLIGRLLEFYINAGISSDISCSLFGFFYIGMVFVFLMAVLPVIIPIVFLLATYGTLIYYNAFLCNVAVPIITLVPTICIHLRRSRDPMMHMTSDLTVFVSILLIVFLICQEILGIKWYEINFNKNTTIEWFDIIAHCGNSGIITTSKFDRGHNNNTDWQTICSNLIGNTIVSHAYINSIHITDYDNPIITIAQAFPVSFRRYIICLFGQCSVSWNDKDDIISSQFTYKCNIQIWTRCEIMLNLRMQMNRSEPHLILIGNNTFYNLLKNLQPNDYIWFAGKLLKRHRDVFYAQLSEIKY